MAREIFIDTGAWLALADQRDPYHQAARVAYRGIQRWWPRWVTTNHVCAEAYTLILRRGGHTHAIRFLLTARNTSRLLKVYSDEALEITAEDILRRYADQPFSFTDAVSFALMRQRGISEAFAFDHHFLTAGFTLVPAAPR